MWKHCIYATLAYKCIYPSGNVTDAAPSVKPKVFTPFRTSATSALNSDEQEEKRLSSSDLFHTPLKAFPHTTFETSSQPPFRLSKPVRKVSFSDNMRDNPQPVYREPSHGFNRDFAPPDHYKHRVKEDLIFNPRTPYGGESFTFWSWKSRMQRDIEEAELSAIDSLCVLQKNTINRPRKIIDNLIASGASADATLDLVWNTLTSRFGSSYKLADEMFGKIDSFPVVKSPKTQLSLLEDFLDLSRLIEVNIPHSKELQQMNLSSGIGKMLDKLPEFLHERWRSHWYKFNNFTGEDPDFFEFVRFVEKMVNEFSIPVRSTRHLKHVKTLRTDLLESGKATSSHFENVKKFCLFHKASSHNTAECFTLAKKDYHFVKNLIIENKACFKCL